MKFILTIALLVGLCVATTCCTGINQYVFVGASSQLVRSAGKNVEISGRLSDIQQQHVKAYREDYPNDHLFDTSYGEQVVIYVKDKIECRGELIIKGTAIEVAWPDEKSSKSPGFTEYQVLVHSWECKD